MTSLGSRCRSSRVTALLLLVSLASSNAHADDRWSALWRNADQRGEQLLQQGDAAGAANTFADPRRKAFAKLKASEYPAAAKAYSAFDEGDAHYNRGNALAHTGDLKEALKAYETALARDPNNRDAQHNRDLVEQALKQQEQQEQQQSSGQNQDAKDGDAKNQQSDSGENADPQNTGKSDQKEASQEPGDTPPSETAKQSGADAGSKPEGDEPNSQQASEAKPEKGDDAKAAKRDAQASVEEAAREQQAKPERAEANRAGEKPAGTAHSVSEKPLTEQQLAQEQWLRRIPDDPGGLLRRKFLIEHMLREQQQKQPP